MKRCIRVGVFVVAVACFNAASAIWAAEARFEIQFPDLPDYQTLKCDVHMHTMFSDGQVWPTVRVTEAWRQGLDAIAITDHIEYQPHKDDVPTKHGRAFELAEQSAAEYGMLFVEGAEITRDTPPGHFNALFLNDVAAIDTPEFLDAVKRANDQKGFVFWNHQGWKGEEKGKWFEVHETMFQKKLFHGMEVCNGETYYPTAHGWCLDKNLTMLGTSDIHTPDLRIRNTANDHRTITLVFSKERTVPALKEALFTGRTVVWHKDLLIGRQAWLEPLLNVCVRIEAPTKRSDKFIWVPIRNASEADIRLERNGDAGPAQITLPATATTLVRFDASAASAELRYTATNFWIGPNKGLPLTLRLPAGADSATVAHGK